ncbi:MAG: hypothetical protein ACOVP4_05560 [Bacteriovoracaceae bacterium]|jgi:hypothetical protein
MKLSTLALLFFSLTGFAQDLRLTLAGKDILIPKLGSKETLPSHQRFSSFLKSTFNKPGPFHGPNCYNTALIASGYSQAEAVRYVSPEEFEEVVKVAFKQVENPTYKDIIVFDAKSSRGHAAFYLGDDLIFHKKSYGTQYHYRMTNIEKAGVVEENEWTPGIMDDSSLQMNWPELGKLSQNYYRLHSKLKPKLEPKLASLILKMEEALLKDLGSWAIARKWGMSGEYFLEDLLVYAKNIKANAYTIAVLTSLKDQVYIMLEEVNFKNARNPSKVMRELCVPEEKQQLFDFIKDFGKVLGKKTENIHQTLQALEQQDRTRCSFKIFSNLNK